MPLRDGGRNVRPIVPLAVVAGFIVLSLVLGAGSGGSGRVPQRIAAADWRGLVGAPRPQATVGQRMIVVLRAPSLAERVARAGGLATEEQERAWTAAAYATQKQLIADLGAHGLQVAIEYSYARVLNGFSAALDARAAALLERSDQVVGVYPVRAVYPAAVDPARLGVATGSVSAFDGALPGFDGRGVTIALLDTGVDRTARFLHGHVLAGYDALGTARTAAAQTNPFDDGAIERHGTQMAGILVGSGGPGGARGVASGATVLPIRVAGWQLDARGEPAVLGRTDQLIAGLERAVDPNDDGDAHDAARIALLPLSEPYAAFGDSPEARAADGALALDTLVVAAAGNDGPAGPDFGSISGPGGAAGALTVGAADTRPLTEEARVALRTGLLVGFDRPVPLAGSVLPTHRVEGELAAPRGGNGTLAGLFDRRGFSLVAGRIALLPAGEQPTGAAQAGARAGASAVILYGRTVPAGAIGLGAGVDVPVVSIATSTARPVLAAIRAGRPAVASIGAPHEVTNGSSGHPASFSSRGLAFDGRLKPDLLAPGVSILTSEPGPGRGLSELRLGERLERGGGRRRGSRSRARAGAAVSRRGRAAQPADRHRASDCRRERDRAGDRARRPRRQCRCRAGRGSADARARPRWAGAHDSPDDRSAQPVAAPAAGLCGLGARGPRRRLDLGRHSTPARSRPPERDDAGHRHRARQPGA